MQRELIIFSIASFLTLRSCGESGEPPGSASTTGPTSATPSVPMEPMPQVPATVADWAHGTMLCEGFGKVRRAITTWSAEAQKYFNQGLALMWAFNHDETTRSVAKAAELDAKCASCFRGVSLTVGCYYNLPLLIMERFACKAAANRSRAPVTRPFSRITRKSSTAHVGPLSIAAPRQSRIQRHYSGSYQTQHRWEGAIVNL